MLLSSRMRIRRYFVLRQPHVRVIAVVWVRRRNGRSRPLTRGVSTITTARRTPRTPRHPAHPITPPTASFRTPHHSAHPITQNTGHSPRKRRHQHAAPRLAVNVLRFQLGVGQTLRPSPVCCGAPDVAASVILQARQHPSTLPHGPLPQNAGHSPRKLPKWHEPPQLAANLLHFQTRTAEREVREVLNGR